MSLRLITQSIRQARGKATGYGGQCNNNRRSSLDYVMLMRMNAMHMSTEKEKDNDKQKGKEKETGESPPSQNSDNSNNSKDSILGRMRRFKSEWSEMQSAMKSEPDAPGEIPFVSPITLLREVPLKLQLLAMKDAWRMYKLGFNPFNKKNKKIYYNIAVEEEALVEDLKNRYRRQLLVEYEVEMKKKHGPSYSLDLDAAAMDAKAKEKEREEKIKEIDRHINEFADEVTKNAKLLFGNLFKSGQSTDERAAVLKAFVEERLMIMNEALSDLQSGYQEGKKASLEHVLKNEKYLEELEQSVAAMKDKAESLIRSSPAVEALGKIYEQQRTSSNTPSGNMSSSSNDNINGDETIKSPTFSNKASEEIYNRIVTAKSKAEEAIAAPLKKIETMAEDEIRMKEELKRAAHERGERLVDSFKGGFESSFKDLGLEKKLEIESSRIQHEEEVGLATASDADKELSKKVEQFSAFVRNKKAGLTERLKSLQAGPEVTSMSADYITTDTNDKSTTSVAKERIENEMNKVISKIANTIPSDNETPSSPIDNKSSGKPVDKDLRKIDDFMGTKIDKLGDEIKSKMSNGGLFSSLFSFKASPSDKISNDSGSKSSEEPNSKKD